MAWECPCGVLNRDSKAECRACRTPQGMVWSPQGLATPAEARFWAKMTRHSAPSPDYLGRLVRILWMAAAAAGAWAGVYLGRTRFHKGRWAVKSVLHSWENLPRTFWSNWHRAEITIGIGIILGLFLCFSPRLVRQNMGTVFGQLVFALILAGLVGMFTYYVVVFAYDLGPYFRFRW